MTAGRDSGLDRGAIIAGVTSLRLPDGVLGMADRGPAWATWVESLPHLAAGLLEDWELGRDGATMHGHCALVVPVRTGSGRPAVLKVAFPDEESEHERLALGRWNGRGAVTLLRADPHRSAMLLERLHQERLTELWDLEACEVVAGLYARLHVPAIPQLRPLTAYVARWSDDLARLPTGSPLPRRLVDQAVSLARGFVDDPDSTGTMIHADLHYENVLAGDREPWLAIDPKPVSGDPHYEPAPMLWNRYDELAGDVRRGVRARFHALVDHAGLDEHRARDWVVVRMLHSALWRLQDDAAHHATSTADHLTRCIAIAKAVQD